jgi:hypothetical protein
VRGLVEAGTARGHGPANEGGELSRRAGTSSAVEARPARLAEQAGQIPRRLTELSKAGGRSIPPPWNC